MEEKIFELLEKWDEATFYEDEEQQVKISEQIKVLREAYRERSTVEEDVKVVGVFNGNMCKIRCNDLRIATIFDLRYTGVGSDFDNTRMYKNDDTYIWLDYAVYE